MTDLLPVDPQAACQAKRLSVNVPGSMHECGKVGAHELHRCADGYCGFEWTDDPEVLRLRRALDDRDAEAVSLRRIAKDATHIAAEAVERRNAAEAALDDTRTELAEAKRQRDLAIAHDTQPYPTAWAYEQAVKALNAKTIALRRIRSIGATSGTRPGTAMNEIFDIIDRALAGVTDTEKPAETMGWSELGQLAEALLNEYPMNTIGHVVGARLDYLAAVLAGRPARADALGDREETSASSDGPATAASPVPLPATPDGQTPEQQARRAALIHDWPNRPGTIVAECTICWESYVCRTLADPAPCGCTPLPATTPEPDEQEQRRLGPERSVPGPVNKGDSNDE